MYVQPPIICILWCILSHSIGTSKPGASLELERGIRESEGAGACMTFNPNINLSITQQRQRLPIFQVQYTVVPINVHAHVQQAKNVRVHF